MIIATTITVVVISVCWVHSSAYVEVRRQLSGVDFPLPPGLGFQGHSQVTRFAQQVPLPAEPLYLSNFVISELCYF